MNKDNAERLKHLSCNLLETLDQQIIERAKGNLPQSIIDDLEKGAESLFVYNQLCVRLSK